MIFKLRLLVLICFIFVMLSLFLVIEQFTRLMPNALEEATIDRYMSITNIIQADSQYNARPLNNVPSLAWCSQCSDNNLHYIPKLAAFWDGPMSIAVFTYGSNIQHTLKYISALHNCDANIKRWVNFHLCIPIKEMGDVDQNIAVGRLGTNISCNVLRGKINYVSINFADTRVEYPVNVLRNLAMKNSNSQYVLNVDIDLTPSKNLYSELIDFFTKPNVPIEGKTAFILPSFETNASQNAPVTKHTLLEMMDRDTVRPFHFKTCPPCYAHTDYQRWKSLQVGHNLSVAYYPAWKELWEPYLIVRMEEVPDFNERFNGYGYDRISHMYEVYRSGFIFAVFDRGFLIHDGFKDKKQLPKNAEENNLKNFAIYNQLKQTYTRTGRGF